LLSYLIFIALCFQVPIHTSAPNVEQETEEIRQLRDNVVALTARCAQLDEANRSWQQYQQTQSDNFRAKLVDYLPIDENTPLIKLHNRSLIILLRKKKSLMKDFKRSKKPTMTFV